MCMTYDPDCQHPVNARPPMRHRGFTLTEVMIVIVIIVILAALLFPFARSMRERAQSAVCAGNLKQIGIGLHAYISENNGRLPNGQAFTSYNKDSNGNSLGISWYDAAAKNLGREEYSTKLSDPAAKPLPDIFGCPAGHGKPYHPEWPYTGDYAGSFILGNKNDTTNPLTLAAVKNPSSTPYVQDTVKQNNFGANIYSTGFSKTAGNAFAARHGGKGNVLWVDGHVSSLGHAEYVKLANDSRYGGAANFMRGNW
jgi:prepilin-type N-terminal cleavage/methylation domain-containing protein/prepilin-type processing-associated H-X9-DG protein